MIANQAFQKSVNLALVMRTLRYVPAMSRTELAAATGLTKSTVGNLVRELMARGILVESRTPPSGAAGRPRVGIAWRRESVTVLGVEIRTDGISLVESDLDGTLLDRRRQVIDRPARSLEELWTRAATQVASRISPRLAGIAVALPATVNPAEGTVLEAEDFAAGGTLPSSLEAGGRSIPVVIENDANAVAWGALAAERRRGTAGRINLVAVTGRRETASAVLRIGTGLVLDSRVYYGSDYGGGEFRAIGWRRGMSGELVGRAASAPEAVRELLENLALVASLLRPTRIVTAGDLADDEALVRATLAGPLSGSFLDPAVGGIPLVPAWEGHWAVAAGAAAMFLEHLFAVPHIDHEPPRTIPGWESLTRA